VHNLVPDWNVLSSESDWRGAWQQLELTNNFPEFTGRICPAPCEDGCTLSINSDPVTIRSIELAIAEHAWTSGFVQPQPAQRRRCQRVAIVGSGPAGLACAQQLARAGYRVSVFEKADRVGGLLRYGIPDFRLDKRVLDRRLEQLRLEGVRFITGVHVGVDVSLDTLRRRMHAVVLATGAGQARDLPVRGREQRGIVPAMDYLRQQNRCNAGDVIAPEQRIDAGGKNVVVIGGGDTGGDCVGTAIRQGARSVTQVQYHERPPSHVDRLLYWPQPVPQWQPTDHDEEGCHHIWGYDTVAFAGHAGRVSALIMQPLYWSHTREGGWRKTRLAGRARHVDAQLVLLATGFAHTDHAGLVTQAGLALDACGNIAADEQDYRTSVDDVFACGDGRRGQSLVVWAIREGRQCARAVDLSLSGTSCLAGI
jgi:glutamate synthase (NADPH/NADH) small chain